mgnify:CR=1 FL=1
MKNYLFTSSILLSFVNLAFFIYGFHQVHIISNTVHGDCRNYFKYNIGVLSLFAVSILVTLSYICCSVCMSSIFYILNAISLVSIAIDKYVRHEYLCNYKCEMNCVDLYDLGNKIEYFFITDLAIIALTCLLFLFLFCKKFFKICSD